MGNTYQLIIDDDYIEKMGNFYYNIGEKIDEMLEKYIEKMEEVKDTAIMKGDIADSLDDYIEYAQSLKNEAGDIGNSLKELTGYFMTAIEEADDYLF